MDLKNKWSLVTGSARRVGKAIALSLAENGSNIYLHYGRSVEEAIATKNQIEEFGVEVISIQANLSGQKDISLLIDKITQNDNIDILVNSAATFQKKDFSAITSQDWDEVITTNLKSPYFLTQQVARLMKVQSKEGVIVNIADLSGIYPWKGFSHHGISKAGIIQLTKSAAWELAPGIRVNCIIPGPILPPPSMNEDDEIWQKMIGNLPLKRSGNPLNISKTVLFLIANDYITGSVIFVDGGEHLMGNQNHLI